MSHNPESSIGIFAVGTLLATDDVVADEILAQGLEVKGRSLGWVTGIGSIESAYRVMLHSKVGDRVVWVLDSTESPTPEAFREFLSGIQWFDLLYPGTPIRVDISGKINWLRDTRFAGQLVMDAIRDQAVIRGAPRPEYESADPGVRIAVRFGRGQVDIGITLNLTPLHQRGHRTDGGEAPLRDTLAQVMLHRLKVDSTPADFIIDPCCGSGTLLIEAATRLGAMAPQRLRSAQLLSKWTGLETISWTDLVAEAKGAERPVSSRLIGFDFDPDAVDRARENVERAGLSNLIEISQADLHDLRPEGLVGPQERGWIIANPPYGERLAYGNELPDLYRSLGEVAKQFQGSQLGVITSNPELSQSMKLRADKKWEMQAGGLRLVISRFPIADTSELLSAMEGVEKAPPEEVMPLLNRITGNIRKRAKLLKNNDIDCYRIYDADLPEFNVVIDRFGEHLHIQEYRPPKTVDAKRAAVRRQLIRQWVPKHLGLSLKQAIYKERFRQQGNTQYEKQDSPLWISAHENGLFFDVNLTTYTDVGLFLDHRPLRRWLLADTRGKKVLNLFCYTGALSVAAAKGLARQVTSIDTSRTYLGWAERNFSKNGLNPLHYEFIRTNILEWLLRDPDPKYDLIILDPPTFSNTKSSDETLDIQRDHAQLLWDTAAWLKPGGVIYFSNNAKGFKLDDVVLDDFLVTDLTSQSIDCDFDRGRPHSLFRLTEKPRNAQN